LAWREASEEEFRMTKTVELPLLTTPCGTYRFHEDWAAIPEHSRRAENGRTHGVAVSRDGRVLVFHQAAPAMLVYSPDGRLLASWGNYPGAHGLTLVEEAGEEFLWLTDQERAVVEKTSLDGRLVGKISAPPYAASEPYVPTWVAVNEARYGGNGDVWAADGYGSNCVNRYDAAGNYVATIDGSEGAGRFNCPHGIWFDSRKRPMQLYVADRGNRCVQVYDHEGRFVRSFGSEFLTSPDGFALDGDCLIVPELLGRVTILDGEDRLLCHVGTNEGVCAASSWPDKTPLVPGRFNSPHAAAVDRSRSIYVVEWRIGGRLLKLERIAATIPA
jgi:hypothetical protein